MLLLALTVRANGAMASLTTWHLNGVADARFLPGLRGVVKPYGENWIVGSALHQAGKFVSVGDVVLFGREADVSYSHAADIIACVEEGGKLFMIANEWKAIQMNGRLYIILTNKDWHFIPILRYWNHGVRL